VVCKLWTYIKANELQDPTDKRKILLDAAMAEVFGVQELTMFSLNKELTSHLSNIPVPAPVQQEGGSVDGGSVGDGGSMGDGVGNGSGNGVDHRDLYDDADDDVGDDRDDYDRENDNDDDIEDEAVSDGELEGEEDEGGRDGEGEAAAQSDVTSPGLISSLLVRLSDLYPLLPSLLFSLIFLSYLRTPLFYLLFIITFLPNLAHTSSAFSSLSPVHLLTLSLLSTCSWRGGGLGMLTQGLQVRDRGLLSTFPPL
jgi:SWIB/MDM2 domain